MNRSSWRIRISAAAICRIEIDGRYLLEVKKGRDDMLGAIGGAYVFEESSRAFLKSLGAEFEHENDLRLTLPVERVDEFGNWFRRRGGRETSPFRELREELVDEHRALARFDPNEVTCRFLDLVTIEESSPRHEAHGALTRYFFDVFDVKFPPAQRRQLVDRAADPASRLRLATREQIEAASEIQGVRVPSHIARVFFGARSHGQFLPP